LFLFIFESIGTSELILIGIVALIFLGPRRMPEMARKLGKMMSDLRSATNEFKETWEREVNFEEETKAIREFDLPDTPVARENTILNSEPETESPKELTLPEIKQVDPAILQNPETTSPTEPVLPVRDEANVDINDKRNWL
jgi:Tat protein translocase TatB subunit